MNTTPTEVSLTLRLGETQKAEFGNRVPGATPTPVLIAKATPEPKETLPKAGSTLETVATVTVGAIVTILGIIGMMAL